MHQMNIQVPFDVCGRGCVVKDGDEKCVDEELDTLTDIPEDSELSMGFFGMFRSGKIF